MDIYKKRFSVSGTYGCLVTTKLWPVKLNERKQAVNVSEYLEVSHQSVIFDVHRYLKDNLLENKWSSFSKKHPYLYS